MILTGSVELSLVDENDSEVYTWTVNELFVKTVAPISVAQSNEGYATQQVTFAFRTFETKLKCLFQKN